MQCNCSIESFPDIIILCFTEVLIATYKNTFTPTMDLMLQLELLPSIMEDIPMKIKDKV